MKDFKVEFSVRNYVLCDDKKIHALEWLDIECCAAIGEGGNLTSMRFASDRNRVSVIIFPASMDMA